MWTLPDPDLALHRPQPLLAHRADQQAPLPLYDAAAAKAIEASVAAGRPAHRLMQLAGLGVARLALALAPHAQRVWIVAGGGNNGGDGFEAALHLHRAGRDVQVAFTGEAERLPADAARSLARARAAGVPIVADLAAPAGLGPADLVVDAVLGRGLSRPAEGRAAEAIRCLAASPAPVLAVDLPSGLPGDTGAPAPHAPVVTARWTLALLSLAPGLFTAQGRDLAGDLWWDDLGVAMPAPAQVAPAAWLAGGAGLLRTRPARRHAQHKGSHGDVWVVGGAAQMGGAAVLAARAALRAGAGRVYVSPLAPAGALADASHPELMLGRLADLDDRRLREATVVAGCGGGGAIAAALPRLLQQAGRLVLDADALNAIATDPALLALLRGREHTVLTPHPLEAARLLGSTAPAVQADRLQAARTLARTTAATVVLKGSGSVVAAPDETPWLLPVGNAALATPGSGDVLAGWLGGLWSQWPADAPPAEAARLAVWTHGWTAERLSPDARPLPASQLAAALACV